MTIEGYFIPFILFYNNATIWYLPLKYCSAMVSLIALLQVEWKISRYTVSSNTDRQKLWWAVSVLFDQLLKLFTQNRSQYDLSQDMKWEKSCTSAGHFDLNTWNRSFQLYVFANLEHCLKNTFNCVSKRDVSLCFIYYN